MNPCFLDTSAVLDLLRGRPSALAAIEPYDELLLPFIVVGELVAGVHGADNPSAELHRLELWLADAEVVGADGETAYLYGELLGTLERGGQRVPINDVWVASIAIQFDLPLLARDEHFRRLRRLRWINY